MNSNSNSSSCDLTTPEDKRKEIDRVVRLTNRLLLLQKKVEIYAFYIEKATELLEEEKPNVPIFNIEEWVSRMEHDIRCGGGNASSESITSSESGGSYETTEEMAERICAMAVDVKCHEDIDLTCNETLDASVDQKNEQTVETDKQIDEFSGNHPRQIGVKVATAGWFVNEGEMAVLAHDDGCCSLYDIVNREGKGEYLPEVTVPTGIWNDCWTMRVPGVDGSSGKYVVAASAGNTNPAGFCSWDYYSKKVHSFRIEDALPSSRAHPTSSNYSRRNTRDVFQTQNIVKWWYKPCGPLMVSGASCENFVKVFDIRDGEEVMQFELQMPLSSMEYCSPLQWRDKGKVVLAQSNTVSLWDLNSLRPRQLVSSHTSNQKITALHIDNVDAEYSYGVRKRASKFGLIKNDGVFCTADFINLLDFRCPSGVGIKIPISNVVATSVFSDGDTILIGASHQELSGKRSLPQVQQFSFRKQTAAAITTFPMPESSTESISDDITQVWGDSHFVMAVSSLGLGGFLVRDFTIDGQRGAGVCGPHDMADPSFDFASSRILLIPRDRPAIWMNIN